MKALLVARWSLKIPISSLGIRNVTWLSLLQQVHGHILLERHQKG